MGGEEKIFCSKDLIDGRFEIEYPLGHGAFAELYLVKDKTTGGSVAMKVEKNEEGSREKMSEEVRIQKYLSDCGISVPKLEWFAQESDWGHKYMTMERLGVDLSWVRKHVKHNKLSMCTVGFLGKQLIKILDDVHKEGVIHRDIKPQNCLLGYQNQVKVYLCDFGLARQYSRDDDTCSAKSKLVGRKANTGCSFRGTAAYASLGAMTGIEQGRRDDLQGLFWVMLDLLIGGVPWRRISLSRAKRDQVIMKGKKSLLNRVKKLERDGLVRLTSEPLSGARSWQSTGFELASGACEFEKMTRFGKTFAGPFMPGTENPNLAEEIGVDDVLLGLPKCMVLFILGLLKLEFHWVPPYGFFKQCFEELERIGDTPEFYKKFKTDRKEFAIYTELYGIAPIPAKKEVVRNVKASRRVDKEHYRVGEQREKKGLGEFLKNTLSFGGTRAGNGGQDVEMQNTNDLK